MKNMINEINNIKNVNVYTAVSLSLMLGLPSIVLIAATLVAAALNSMIALLIPAVACVAALIWIVHLAKQLS